MPGDAQRLDQGRDVQVYVIGKWQAGFGRQDDFVGEAAAAAGEPDEAAVVAGVFYPGAAGAAGAAVNCRLYGDFLADFEV